MRRWRVVLTVGVLVGLGVLWKTTGNAQRPAIEVTPEMLQRVLKDFEVGDNWIYNDLERAEQLARETGKPLFVLFRCVPCQACKAFDQEVLRADAELRELLAQYVPVRIVRMNRVDLGRFQYDYDLSWAAFLMNADGTIYGRYGIRAGHDSETHISVASLKRALRRGLELHREYPKNRHLFAGKEARPVRFRWARDMLPLQRVFQEEDLRKGCVHCHMVKEAQIQIAQQEGTWSKDKIWEFLVWPLPENVGMVIDVDRGNVIREVIPGSFADRAGLRPGDELWTLNGQVILSQADIQWVLYHLPTPGTVSVEYLRNGQRKTATLRVEGDWRKSDISWRASMWSLLPKLGFWAPELSPERKQKLGLRPDALALEVRWIPNAAARKAGLRNKDIIVAADGIRHRMRHAELAQYVVLNKEVGETLQLTVLRDGRGISLEIPLASH